MTSQLPNGVALPYGFPSEQDAFEKLIDQNPLESTTHKVYADWLDENGQPDEAAFRRAMGEWIARTGDRFENKGNKTRVHRYDPREDWMDDGYAVGGKLGWPEGVLSNNPTDPTDAFDYPRTAGVNPNSHSAGFPRVGLASEAHHPIGWNKSESTDLRNFPFDQGVLYNLRWRHYRGMEEALRRAFMTNLQRQRQQTPDEQYADTPPIEYDDSLDSPQDEFGQTLSWTDDDKTPVTEVNPQRQPSGSDVFSGQQTPTIQPESMDDETKAYIDVLHSGAGGRSFAKDLEGFMTFVPDEQRKKVFDKLNIPHDHPDPKQAMIEAFGHVEPAPDDEQRPSVESIEQWVQGLDAAGINEALQFYGLHGERDEDKARGMLSLAVQSYNKGNRQPPQMDNDPGFNSDARTAMERTPAAKLRELGAGEAGANESFLVTFENGEQGIFKPSAGEKYLRRGIPVKNYYRREVAASLIADLLGMHDMVPPTTFRHEQDQGIGSIQQIVDGEPAGALDKNDRFKDSEGALRAAIFDYIIGHQDRHTNNWMIRPDGKIVLIDNGLAFPVEKSRSDFDLGKRHRTLEFLRHASDNNLELPDLRSLGRSWPAIENAMRSSGIEDAAIALTKQRFDAITSGRFKYFGLLPSPWHTTPYAPNIPLKRYL